MIPWTDGHVHQLTRSTVEGRTRKVTTKCGATLNQTAEHPLFGATGFHTRITCPACLNHQ